MRPVPVEHDIKDDIVKRNLENIHRVLHNISFGDGTNTSLEKNLDIVYIGGVTNVTPNTETLYNHQLGRIPKGFVVVMRDKAGTIYKGSTTWSATQISLKADIASITFTIFVF